jgi:hypothetical protein
MKIYDIVPGTVFIRDEKIIPAMSKSDVQQVIFLSKFKDENRRLWVYQTVGFASSGKITSLLMYSITFEKQEYPLWNNWIVLSR